VVILYKVSSIIRRHTVLSVADPMRNVSRMLFTGGTELGTQVKTGSRAGRTHTLNNPPVEYIGVLLCKSME